jgi:glycosyltransferase involved in cell wall biosynthesis
MTSKLRITTGIDLPLEPSCGSMIFCSDLYQHMSGRFSTTFLALPPASPAWRHGFDQTVLCGAVKAPYGPGFPRYADELTGEVRRLLAAQPADVIHAQHLGFGLALAFTRAAGDIPVIAVAHGTDVIAAAESRQARETLMEITESAAAVITPTASLARRIQELASSRIREKIAVVPWGIPLQRMPRPPLRAPGRALRLLHAGRLDGNKSTLTAIDAMALTSGQHELTIIGSGPALGSLRQRSQDLGLRGRVRFIPFQPRHSLWEQFGAFDAFLFTTAGLEAFGLVAVEAQARGLPVIYAGIEGMTGTLGAAGIAYPPGDAGQLALAVDKLAAAPSLHRELSVAGIANAARYDIARSADRIAEITQQVTGAAA